MSPKTPPATPKNSQSEQKSQIIPAGPSSPQIVSTVPPSPSFTATPQEPSVTVVISSASTEEASATPLLPKSPLSKDSYGRFNWFKRIASPAAAAIIGFSTQLGFDALQEVIEAWLITQGLDVNKEYAKILAFAIKAALVGSSSTALAGALGRAIDYCKRQASGAKLAVLPSASEKLRTKIGIAAVPLASSVIGIGLGMGTEALQAAIQPFNKLAVAALTGAPTGVLATLLWRGIQSCCLPKALSFGVTGADGDRIYYATPQTGTLTTWAPEAPDSQQRPEPEKSKGPEPAKPSTNMQPRNLFG